MGWQAWRPVPARRAVREPSAVTYGSPRAWLELRRQGMRVGHQRVVRLMRTDGLQGARLW
jgi:hypothetical protein